MEEYCDDCNRWFRNIRAHYIHSSNHIYCERCDRDFTSTAARQAHWENSSAHNRCGVCGFDGYDCDELEEHFYATDCYECVCYGCHSWFLTSSSYHEHQAAVVACSKCAKHCHTQAKLKQHMAAEHQEATLECWGCCRMFVRVSDMISHLESGGCPSGCSLEDISYRLMVESTSLRQFVEPRYRQDFRRGVDIGKVHGQAMPFVCEGCCVGFRLLSGLCQHLESGGTSCDRRISDVSLSPLKREFENKFPKQTSLKTSSY